MTLGSMGQGACTYTEHSGALRNYVGRRVRLADDSDDIVQEAFLRFHARRGAEAVDAPLSYLFRIVANLIADRGRSARSLAQMIDIAAVDEAFLSTAPEQENGRRRADLQRAYDLALAELSPRCRSVFILRRHHGATTPEVAAQLRISARAVQKHMVRATAHLQRALRDFLDEVDLDKLPTLSVVVARYASARADGSTPCGMRRGG
jgi:RNA polymerase sigma-70 factor (ECF subfamily)